jgi:DNA helicase-2/ATP-dependent DNA helicase PcrA
MMERRVANGNPASLLYVIKSATSIDWNLLDLFYRLCGFQPFRGMFDLAEKGRDEGPVCNLGLISQYLARFSDEYVSLITGDLLQEDKLQHILYMSYLFALFRRGESEYEDAEDPFPRGRIPFLTIHQSKGLEFPVVVLGNPRKDDHGPQLNERLLHTYIERDGEPLDKQSQFDIMRMFYVALSRAQKLVVLAHFTGSGQRRTPAFDALIGNGISRIPDLKIASVPKMALKSDETPRNYSFTSDYMMYQKCPRQYMVFRKYGFVPSRTSTMMFGSLVHRTLDDLHQFLIGQRENAPADTKRGAR